MPQTIPDPFGGSAGLAGDLGVTDNAIVRADGTDGDTAQGSGLTVDDSLNLGDLASLRLAEQASGPTPGAGLSAVWALQGTNVNLPYFTDENGLDVALMRTVTLTRSMPASFADSIELGSFVSSEGQAFEVIILTGTSTSNDHVAHHRILVQNAVSTGGWVCVRPDQSSGPLNRANFGDLIQLEMDVSVGGAISLRARSYVGSSTDVLFRIKFDGQDEGVFTESSTTATTTVATTNYSRNIVTHTTLIASAGGIGEGAVYWKPIYFEERAADAGNVAGYGQIWVQNTSPCTLMFTDDTGTDFTLYGGAAGGDVGGDTGSTDEAVLLADGTGGSTLKTSSLTVADIRNFNPVKRPVRVATTATVTLSGGAPDTVDGVSVAANDRVLVKDQSAGAENGIYEVTTVGTGTDGTWTRTADFSDASTDYIEAGVETYVQEGTAHGQARFTLTTTGAITIGTTALTFT